MAADMAGRGRLRAAHADREHVIDVLKAAFVQGLLTKSEFDMRVGQTFASRTYAELAALTADIRAGLIGAQPLRKAVRAPENPARAPENKVVDSSENKVVNSCACAIFAILALGAAFSTGNLGLFLLVLAAILGALSVAGAWMIYSRHEKRSRGQQRQRSTPFAGS